MPLPKMLAPFLPRHQQCLQKSKDLPAVREFVLSPALPLSPPSNNHLAVNQNGDPIIGLDTVEEDASAKSDETIMEESDSDKSPTSNSENAMVLHEKPTAFELCDNDLIIESDSDKSPTSNSENAMVLHEKPTAFELCDNDLIIESVKEFQDDNDSFDKDMMRDNTAYQSTTTTPPAGYFGEEVTQTATLVDVTEEIQPAMVPLPPSPPVAATEKEQKPEQFEFIKPIQAEFIQEVFVSPKFEEKQEQKQSHFAMETTFKRAKENSDFKSKCKEIFKGLVCKPEVPEDMNRMKSTSAKHDNEPTPAGRGGLGSIDTTFVSAFDREKEEEEDTDMNTPIYRRRNTSGNSLCQLNSAEPVAPYKSPVLGTDAYDIKLLCDQSFFGRW